MKKGIIITTLGAILSLVYLVLYICSFALENYDGDKSVSFNSDFLIMLLIGLIILVCGILYIKNEKKGQSSTKLVSFCFGTIGLIIACVGLGNMFELISDKASYEEIISSMIDGIIGIITLALAIVCYKEKIVQ